MDIYTFKSKFEKLHPTSEVPKEHLPELLINNFLSNPALLLVKDATDIDSIWTRLTDAYGDCKRLLCNKVAELGDVEGICKSKDPEKVIDGLSKVNNQPNEGSYEARNRPQSEAEAVPWRCNGEDP